MFVLLLYILRGNDQRFSSSAFKTQYVVNKWSLCEVSGITVHISSFPYELLCSFPEMSKAEISCCRLRYWLWEILVWGGFFFSFFRNVYNLLFEILGLGMYWERKSCWAKDGRKLITENAEHEKIMSVLYNFQNVHKLY